MKNKYLLILSLTILILSPLKAQKLEIPKGTNTIIAETSLSKSQNYINIIKTLYLNGYAVQYADSTIGVISTQPINCGNIQTLTFSIVVEDNKIILRGQATSTLEVSYGTVSDRGPITEIAFKGMIGSARRDAWNAFNNFACKLSNKITYELQ